jgi:hypothetical protein
MGTFYFDNGLIPIAEVYRPYRATEVVLLMVKS